MLHIPYASVRGKPLATPLRIERKVTTSISEFLGRGRPCSQTQKGGLTVKCNLDDRGPDLDAPCINPSRLKLSRRKQIDPPSRSIVMQRKQERRSLEVQGLSSIRECFAHEGISRLCPDRAPYGGRISQWDECSTLVASRWGSRCMSQ
jgi:hypothetical protein